MDSPEFKEHITELAASIKKYGLLNPITLNAEDNSLVAGFCRLMAVGAVLGRSEIDFRYAQQLSKIERKELELEENIRRKNLEWWEESAAVAEIHSMKKEADPTWTVEKTAQLLGKSKGGTSEAINVAQAIQLNPDLKKEKGGTAAVRKVQTREKIEKRKKEIAVIRRARGGTGIKAEILTGDSLELIKKEPSGSYDCVVTNFPFGVDLTLKNDGGENRELYRDDEEYIVDLVQAMVPEIFRVLKDDSWFVGFFDVRKITYNQDLAMLRNYISNPKATRQWEKAMGLTYWLEQAGFSYVSSLPAFWVKPNKSQGIIGNPQKGMIVAYESFVFASKGEAVLLKQGRNNVFVFDTLPSDDRTFALQMPGTICREVLDMVVLGGGRVLDPFAGVGSFGLQAIEKQCEFRGFEKNPERASDGNLLLAEHSMAETAAPSPNSIQIDEEEAAAWGLE